MDFCVSQVDRSDHDYGCNNADRTFPHKLQSAKEFVHFIGAESQSAMHQRAHAGAGVYGVKVFDFEAHLEIPEELVGVDAAYDRVNASLVPEKSVAVFVVDVRTSKTPWKTGNDRFDLDLEGDFLGAAQWQWLEESLSRSPAKLNIIVGGLQYFAARFPDGNIAEAWTRYPNALNRLRNLILSTSQPTVLVSGDVHMTQLMRQDCHHPTAPPRSIWELTTSGMTHSWGTLPHGKLHSAWTRYQSFVARQMMRSLHYTCSWTDVVDSDHTFLNGGFEGAKRGRQFSLEKNFGEIEIDWEINTVVLRSFGEDGRPLISAQIPLESRPVADTGWTCENHRGRPLSRWMGHAMTGVGLVALAPLPVVAPLLLIFLMLWKGKR